jgi:hypothetical protein
VPHLRLSNCKAAASAKQKRQVMKLSNLTAKLTCIKSTAFRALAVAAIAGAALTAAAPAAQAQQFRGNAHISGPYRTGNSFDNRSGYEGYRPAFNGRDDRRFFEERRAHEEFVRHHEFERYHNWDRR